MSEPVTSYFFQRIRSRSRSRYAGRLVGILSTGAELTSGAIVRIDGRTVTTRSGSVYHLSGAPRWPGHDDVSFYLDTPGADVWPPGATVPAIGDDDV